ncbi:MAG: histidine phosphatase family protein [Candidatus Electrothrix scaldis]|nr:MAG: histidine phosphatase family protein [Candidatus Electrothrix sp. GW3-3]
MKIIHLIRHAKSSWKDGTLADIDRPLNKRGKKSCRVMVKQLVRSGCCFEHIFCSPAVRAQETIQGINKILNLELRWQTNKELYTFDSVVLLEWFRTLNDAVTEPLIIGHNPALTELCNTLRKNDTISNNDISNIPTCGYVQLCMDKDRPWRKLAEGSANLTVFLRPKKFMK